MKQSTFSILLITLWITGCAVESSETPVETYQQKNYLFNSNFSLWQRGKTFMIEDKQVTYGADRWYVKNSLGDNSSIRYNREAPMLAGSKYAARVEIMKAPTANEKNGVELYQTLDNATTLLTFGENLTFSVKIKGLGRTDRIGIQLMYSDTEKMVELPLGEESVHAVITNDFVLAQHPPQRIKSIPNAGVIGVRIRLLERSDGAGHAYDRENGFIVEQAILNPGIVASPYVPKHASFDAEVASCLRFYEKSFSLDEDPPARPLFALLALLSAETDTITLTPKRIVPLREDILLYGGDNASVNRITDRSFEVPKKANRGDLNWTVDAEIYGERLGASSDGSKR